MPGFQLPNITEDNLRDYHRKHFPNTPAPEGSLLQYLPTIDDEDHEYDDYLGYYPDGTERTLTDEQIAIFRHSEVQKMIRLVRKAADDGTLPSSETAVAEALTGTRDTEEGPLNTTVSEPHRQEVRLDATKVFIGQMHPDQSSRSSGQPTKRPANGSLDHNASQTRPRKRRKKINNERRTPINGIRYNPEDYLDESGEHTFRRKCREADEIKEETVNLDY